VKSQPKKAFALLRAVADVIHEHPNRKALALWPAIRTVAQHRNPSEIEVISALLGDA